MAFTTLRTNERWTSNTPAIYFNLEYDRRRNGTAMEYQIRLTVKPLTDGYFTYPIYARMSFDGQELISQQTIKASNPNTWSSDIVYTSEWVSVANKVTGTTSLTLTVYSGSGSSRSQIYTNALQIEGSKSRLALNKSFIDMSGSDSCIATITRDSTSYTHTLEVRVGDEVATYQNLTTSKTFTLPISWNTQCPNSTSIKGYATLYTYSGSTLLGSETKEFWARVPTNILPTFTSLQHEIIDNISLSQAVRDHSKIKLTIVGAQGAYGSTIKSYRLRGWSLSSQQSSATSDFIDWYGDMEYSGIITDSRGREFSKEVTINVLDYYIPIIETSNLVTRCNADGTVNPTTGTSLLVNPVIDTASLGGANTLQVKVSYKKTTETNYSAPVTLTTVEPTILFNGLLDVASNYDIKVSVTDLVTTVDEVVLLPSGRRLVNFDTEQYAMCFGGFVSKPNIAEFVMPALFSQGTIDILIPENSDLNDYLMQGTYRIGQYTALNSPVQHGFRLEVIDGTYHENIRYKTQIITTFRLTPEIYIRGYWNGTFNQWYKVRTGTIAEIENTPSIRNATTVKTLQSSGKTLLIDSSQMQTLLDTPVTIDADKVTIVASNGDSDSNSALIYNVEYSPTSDEWFIRHSGEGGCRINYTVFYNA